MHLIFFLILILSSCNSALDDSIVLQPICGRDVGHAPIYRIKVPKTWVRHDPLPAESLMDTTKALCEFSIDNIIKITIHNFPSESIEQRIPPEAQVLRWKHQFSYLDLSSTSTVPQAFSGFIGLLFEGNGTLNESEQSVMGWSMQLAPIHYRTLTQVNPSSLRDMRSDVTIKVTGPTELIQKHRDQIIRFARSFELIEAIPSKT